MTTLVEVADTLFELSEVLQVMSSGNPYTRPLYIEIKSKDIGDEGALKITEALEESYFPVHEMYISGNSITYKGAIPLIKASIDTGVELLYFDGNPIFDGIKSPADILGCLQNNDTLLHLGLSYTEHTPAVIKYLIDILPTTFLFSITLNGCEVSEEQKNNIRKCLNANHEKFSNQFWSPIKHIRFTNYDEKCHEVILANLICQTEFSVKIPFHIWIAIFGFWKLKLFDLCIDPEDDLSDGDYSSDEEF